MKYFTFAMLFISLLHTSYAQDFFVPNGAFGTAQDHLTSPVKNLEQMPFKERRYNVLDGRIYAIEDEPLVQTDNLSSEAQNTPSEIYSEKRNTIPQIPTQELTNKDIQLQNAPQNKISSINFSRLTSSMETNEKAKRLERYQELFNTYITEREQFKKSHKFPKNKKLEDMLNEFKKPQNITLFQGTLE